MSEAKQLTKRETELINKLREGVRRFYSDGINKKPFALFQGLTLETTSEELDRMIEKNIEEYCTEHNVKFKSEQNRARCVEAEHCLLDIWAHAYLHGLRGEKPEGDNNKHE